MHTYLMNKEVRSIISLNYSIKITVHSDRTNQSMVLKREHNAGTPWA